MDIRKKVAILSGFNNITYKDFAACLKLYEKYYALHTDLFCPAYLQHHYIECNQSYALHDPEEGIYDK